MATSPNIFYKMTGQIKPVNEAQDRANRLYHGCAECENFSMLFGGCERQGVKIKTDEEFEVVKQEFVQHFNDNHKDLYHKRVEKGEREYKRFSDISMYQFSLNINVMPESYMEILPRTPDGTIIMTLKDLQKIASLQERPRKAFGKSIFHKLVGHYIE